MPSKHNLTRRRFLVGAAIGTLSLSGCTEQGQSPTEYEVSEVNPPATDSNISRKFVGTNEGHLFRIKINTEFSEYDRPYTYSLRNAETDEIISQKDYEGGEWLNITVEDSKLDEHETLRFVLNNGTTHYGDVIFTRKSSSDE